MQSEAPEMRNLMCRVERLERQNRWLKRARTAALAAVGAVLLMGQAAPVPKVIEANKFVLQDSTGKTRADLRMVGADPSLDLYDMDGRRRAEFSLRNGYPYVRLYDLKGSTIADFDAEADWPELSLYGGNSAAVELLVQRNNPTVRLNSPANASVMSMSMGDGNPQLFVGDSAGYVTVLGSTELVTPKTGETHHTSAASIVMFGSGKDHKVIWQAPEP